MKFVAILGAFLAFYCPSQFAGAAEKPCSQPEDRQFDFWIGEWDVLNRQRNPGNPTDSTFYPTGSAIGRVYPVADGCAIAEQWAGELSWGRVLGFSLRTYNAETGQWTLLLNWPAPGAATPGPFSSLQGTFHHGRGEFFNAITGPDGKVTESRFTFSDIAEQRYRWDSALSTDGGISWTPAWKMEATRRNHTDGTAKLPGPDPAADYVACAEDAGSQALRFLDGTWSGQSEEGAAIEFEAFPIMDGCAVIERLTIDGDRPLSEFRVRAYQADKGHWVQYAVNDASEGLTELRGAPEGHQLNWVNNNEEEVVERWRLDGEQRLLLESARSDDAMIRVSLTRLGR